MSEESTMIFSGSSRYPQSHGSTIVETTEGDLLAAWYAGSREKGDDVVILTSRRPPGGAEWSPPLVAADTPGKPEGNPVLFQPDPDRLMLFYQTIHGGGEGPTTKTTGWTTCDIKFKTSLDQGRSWGPDVPVRKRWGYVIRTKPLLIDGKILLPTHDEINWASLVMIGEGDGSKWHSSNVVSTGEGFKRGNIEPAIVEVTKGSLLMYMRSGSRTCVWQSLSSDRGNTWSPPDPTNLPNPDSAIDLLRLTDGKIALAFNNSSDSRTPLTLALSEDDGQTWQGFKDLETGPGSFSYPAMTQARDGLIHVSYTYRREGIKHAILHESQIA